MTTIKNRRAQLLARIETAAQTAGKPAHSITLLAVSKTWPAAQLRQAAEAGQRAFGENYLQEALIKIVELRDFPLKWHFIGPIQSNKTKDIATHFDWVHSVDRCKIIQRLADQRPADKPPLNVCIQINIDQEASKSGANSDDINQLAAAVVAQDSLCLRGLMIIPTATKDTEAQRASFERAYDLFLILKSKYSSVDTLSMGMSGDMDLAIASGSTLVRIGTGLFGKRLPPAALSQ